ncbi:MAG: hypothetical protein ABNH00_08050 [Dokdonia sp.]
MNTSNNHNRERHPKPNTALAIYSVLTTTFLAAYTVIQLVTTL